MIALRKTTSRPRLSDLMIWGAFVAPGVVLNKDGSLQTSFRFRGPDLASATEAGLAATMARVNNALRRLPSGWALHVEARRRVSEHYPDVIQEPRPPG
jgi:type IV secretion system protein VirB4